MIKKGDVIFTADKNEKNISSLSLGYAEVSYYHCSLYIGNGQIIEATPDNGVSISDISKYTDNINLVGRIDCSDEFINNVIDYAKQHVGKSYNHLFLPNTDTLYCSELIHKVFCQANNKPIFSSQYLNYINDGKSEISDYWISLYKSKGLSVPQGKEGSHPNNLSLDKAFKYRFFLD